MINVSAESGVMTVALSYAGEAESVQEMLSEISERLWITRYGDSFEDGELVPVDTLTNQERLELINRFVRESLLELYRGQLRYEAALQAEGQIDSAGDPIAET